MKNVVALVLAGGHMGDYGVLTQNRAKGALTFAGIYRIIDFSLSNLVNSGIHQIGIVIQYLPSSLIEHVGVGQPWDLDIYGRTLKIMPPFVGMQETAWYKGTADAVYQNLNFAEDLAAEHVIVLSGEHVYHLDYRDVMQAHIDRDADITLVSTRIEENHLSRRFGFLTTDESGRVTAYHEKPPSPIGDIVSTGIYVFKASVLSELLQANAVTDERNLAKDVLQRNISRCRCMEYRMQEKWEYMENVRDYYDVQFRMLTENNFHQLRQWNIMTNLDFRGVGFAPAARFGSQCEVRDSYISPRCDIEGTVIHSILSPGVRVAPGAVVRDSILMHDCVIEEGALLDHVISDRDARFSESCKVGLKLGPLAPPAESDITQEETTPLTIIGKAVQIGKDVILPPGVQVRPRKRLDDQEAANLEI